MRHRRIILSLISIVCLSSEGDASAQNRRYVEGQPSTLRDSVRASDPDSRTPPSHSGPYAPRLLPGSRAPSLPALTVVRGGEIKEPPPGVVTIVEFWASWCPNCRDRAFQVGELERKYPGRVREIVIVTPDRFGSSEAGARELAQLATGADALGSIAWDATSATRSAWLTPSRRATVPSAFVVNADGLVAWIGHPADMESPIENVISGEWDIGAATEDYALRFRDSAWRDDASLRYRSAANAGRREDMLRALDDLDLFDPSVAGQTAADSIRRLVVDARPFALELALLTEKAVWTLDPRLLNDLAWYLLNTDQPTDDEVIAARRMAERASERSSREDGMIEDTLALALYRDGDRDAAIETQERAIRLIGTRTSGGSQPVDEFQKRLRMYQESEPVTTRQRKRAREQDGQGRLQQ